jgi:nicotinamidase-related amidase
MGKAALVIVDCQNDFMPPDGALAVPNGDQVLPLIKEMLEEKKWTWEVVVATQVRHIEPGAAQSLIHRRITILQATSPSLRGMARTFTPISR